MFKIKEKSKNKTSQIEKMEKMIAHKLMYIGGFFFASVILSMSKMHEIKWMPEVNNISYFYQNNDVIIKNEKNAYNDSVKRTNDFLEKINFKELLNKGNIDFPEKKTMNNEIKMPISERMLRDLYAEELYLYEKNITLYPELKNYFPDDEYVNYRIVNNVNKIFQNDTIIHFNNKIEENLKEIEKNISSEKIKNFNNYIEIKNKEIKELLNNKNFLKQTPYILSNGAYNIFNKPVEGSNNSIVEDFGLINARILTKNISEKLVNEFPNEQKEKIIKSIDLKQIIMTEEEFNIINENNRK